MNESTYLRQIQASADWFYWMAGITILVMIYAFVGGVNAPPLALFTPMMLAGGIGSHIVYSLLLAAGIAAILMLFILLGDAASEGSRQAFALGTLAYALDTLMLIFFLSGEPTVLQRYGSLVVHLCALVAFATGWTAARRLEELRQSRESLRAEPPDRSSQLPPGIVGDDTITSP